VVSILEHLRKNCEAEHQYPPVRTSPLHHIIAETVLSSGLGGVLGELESAHNGWLGLEDHGQHEHVADALVHLGERHWRGGCRVRKEKRALLLICDGQMMKKCVKKQRKLTLRLWRVVRWWRRAKVH
jgi:hypothetical protein